MTRSALAPGGGGTEPGRNRATPSRTTDQEVAAPERTLDLRVVTYNVHSGLGARASWLRSRRAVERNLDAIASTIASAAPPESPMDVVALNEIDFGSRRSAWIDEADFLAGALARRTGQHYTVVRQETWRRDVPGLEVRFGNAALVRHPIIAEASCMLDDAASCPAIPGLATLPRLAPRGWIARLLGEPRGVIKVTLDLGGHPVDVLVTHLDAFFPSTREAQAVHLVQRFVTPARTTVLLGDVNAVPTDLTLTRRFSAHDRTHDILTSSELADTRITYALARGMTSLRSWATFPAAAPVWPLDGVFASLDLVPGAVDVVGDGASDHRALVVHLQGVVSRDDLSRARARHAQLRRRQRERIVACDLAAGANKGRDWLVSATGFGVLDTGVATVRVESPLGPDETSGLGALDHGTGDSLGEPSAL